MLLPIKSNYIKSRYVIRGTILNEDLQALRDYIKVINSLLLKD